MQYKPSTLHAKLTCRRRLAVAGVDWPLGEAGRLGRMEVASRDTAILVAFGFNRYAGNCGCLHETGSSVRV